MKFGSKRDINSGGVQSRLASVMSGHSGITVLALLWSLATVSGPALSAEIQVCDMATLNSAVANARAGDRIVMCNKTWRDVDIAFQVTGTAAAPVKLVAQTPGRVILTGSSRLHLGGAYGVVDGLVFKGAYTGTDTAIMFRSKSDCTNCRLTNTSVINYNPAKDSIYTAWVNLYGQYNRVDHCYFSGKSNSGQVIQVRRSGQADYHRIDYNYFGDRKRTAAGNYGEMIKIGGQKNGKENEVSKTTVENNFFYKADGEGELISVKSSSNTIRHNTVDSSSGKISLRAGNNNVVDSNFIFGRGKLLTGGVEVSGKGHLIINNYISNVNKGSHSNYGGIIIKSGANTVNQKVGSVAYVPVKNVTVKNNTIVNSGYSVSLGKGGYSIAPDNITFTNNLVYSTNGPLIRVQGAMISNSTWSNNVFFKGTLGITKPVGVRVIDPALVVGAYGLYWPDASGPEPNSGVSSSVLAPIGRCDVGPITYNPTGTSGCTAAAALAPPAPPSFL